jgi:hypothetical protein
LNFQALLLGKPFRRNAAQIWCKSAFFGALIFLLAAPISMATGDQAVPKISALTVKQRHEYFGDTRILLTNTAIKVIFLNKGTVVVAKAPAWNVVEYTPQSKVAYQCSFNDWMKGSSKLNFSEDIEATEFKKEGENLIGDERATKYIGNAEKSRSRYWIDEHIGCSEKAAMIVERLYRLPIIKTGLPLELSSSTLWVSEKNSIVWLPAKLKKGNRPQYFCTLITNDIKKIDVPKTEFDYPTHYKSVKSEDDVWLTAPTRSAMNMIIDAYEPSGWNKAKPASSKK